MKKAKELGAAALDTVVAFKLVWLRVACYFFIPAGMLFLAQTEGLTQITWDAMGEFLHRRLYLSCCIAGLSGLCAYLDSSFQRAKERSGEMKVERDVVAADETRFLERRQVAAEEVALVEAKSDARIAEVKAAKE